MIKEEDLGGSHKNHSFRRIIQSAYKFLSGPSQSKKNNIIFSYLINSNLVNDQHSALEISDLSELAVHFSGTVAETANNIHILHNHNLWWVLSYSM
jgi:hypothetical protein